MEEQECMRCGKPVQETREDYEVFERMHWDCFHFEFEHNLYGDIAEDVDCGQPSCPVTA
ncbi:hypothetical protein [Kribbella antibiotica]|uniref:hypothetical protein n=1 Tax=Kribbella antibiotica TaxID=190195 RepID=UPI0014049AFF|nr:hypothetical protein [Kribbella antibiotica]